MDLGLARVQALLRRVGSPHTKIPVIHVAGTNGKGSTIAYLDTLLTHAVGVRAGRFHSPHLLTARDSVRVQGGAPIDTRIWEQARLQTSCADAHSGPAESDAPIHATPFELLTVQALLAFTLLPPDQRPEVLLIEVGVGGRLDATNVFPAENVLASVICPIARDHEAILGTGLAAITNEKAGIIKDKGLCVIADQRVGSTRPNASRPVQPADPAVVEGLERVCQARHARRVMTVIPWNTFREGTLQGPQRLGAPVAFTLPLYSPGNRPDSPAAAAIPVELEATHARLSGCATALQTLWSVAHDVPPSPPHDTHASLRSALRTRLFADESDAIARRNAALAQYRWEGRCEWHTSPTNQPVLLDGAHNLASALALRQYLYHCLDTYAATAPGPMDVSLTWIMAFSQGKEAGRMLDTLFAAPSSRHAWRCTRQRVAYVPFSTPVEGMPWVAPMDPTALKAAPATAGVDDRQAFGTLEAALAWASKDAHGALDIVVVCGSLYLASDYYRTVLPPLSSEFTSPLPSGSPAILPHAAPGPASLGREDRQTKQGGAT